jgi:hypothetical protein
MHKDLKWLAENISKWHDCLGAGKTILRLNDSFHSAEFINEAYYLGNEAFTRDEWQAARIELGLENPFAACLKESDDTCASGTRNGQKITVHLSSFTTPEEEEEWIAAEKRMEAIGQNGNDGDHYEPKHLSELYPQYYKDVRHLDSVDVYQVHDLFAIEDNSGCLQHASKKLLLSGVRTGGKTKRQDIAEARDTLTRWLELEQGR